MKTIKVSNDFSYRKFSDLELRRRAHHVIKNMTGNSHFTSPEPSIETLSSACNSYILALNKQKPGLKMSTVIKKDCRVNLEELLSQLATYVQVIAKNNESVILSSGFDVHQRKGKVGIPDQANILSVIPGLNRGTLKVFCDFVDKARFYEFQYTPAPVMQESIWMVKASTSRKVLIEGLTSGHQYVFRVAGAGSDPGRYWSDEISSYVM